MMSVLFLGIVGPGPWSLDAVLSSRSSASVSETQKSQRAPAHRRAEGLVIERVIYRASRIASLQLISGRSGSALAARARSLAE